MKIKSTLSIVGFLLILLLVALAATIAYKLPSGSKIDDNKERLWRLYDSEKISFFYPFQFQNFEIKEESDKSERAVFDFVLNRTQESPFQITLYKLNYKLRTDPFGGTSDIFSKPINMKDVENQIRNGYTTMDEIVALKKLSDKSVLVIKYGNYECLSTWSIDVIAPITNSDLYSNIKVKVSEKPFYIRPDSYNESDCSHRISVEELAGKILDGTANQIVLDNISKAQKIAESVVAKQNNY